MGLPDQAATALDELLAGNARFAAGTPQHPHQSDHWRSTVAAAQHPIATVLGCADSRVPPEILFDRGVGDLFVVRTAGHVIDAAVAASIEFSVVRLGVPLVVVLGHDRCGAVMATLDVLDQGSTPSAELATLVAALEPSTERARRTAAEQDDPAYDVVAAAVRANIHRSCELLRGQDPVISPLVRAGRVAVVGADYHLDSGRLTIVDR